MSVTRDEALDAQESKVLTAINTELARTGWQEVDIPLALRQRLAHMAVVTLSPTPILRCPRCGAGRVESLSNSDMQCRYVTDDENNPGCGARWSGDGEPL